jgi:hypothetical protein
VKVKTRGKDKVDSPPIPLSRTARRLWWRVRHRVRQLVRRLGQRDSMTRFMYVHDLDLFPRPADRSRSVDFRELSKEEILRYWEKVGGGAPIGPERPTEDTGCIVGLLDGRLIYHAWYVRADGDKMRALPPNWHPRGRVLFLHDGFTEPGFRGRGIHTAATFWLLDRERNTDVLHAICVVHGDNVAASRAVERAGFRMLARVY